MNDVGLRLVPRESRPDSTLTAPRGWAPRHVADLDRLLHAMEGRATAGLSLASLWLPFADWSIHLSPLRAPGAGYEVLEDAPGRYVLEH